MNYGSGRKTTRPHLRAASGGPIIERGGYVNASRVKGSTFPIPGIQDAYRLVENFSQPSNVDNGHNQVYQRLAQEFPELSMQAAPHAEQQPTQNARCQACVRPCGIGEVSMWVSVCRVLRVTISSLPSEFDGGDNTGSDTARMRTRKS
jgi:hypothetical protein